MDNKAKTEGDSVGIDVIMADVEKSPHCAHGRSENVRVGPQAAAEVGPTETKRFHSARLCWL